MKKIIIVFSLLFNISILSFAQLNGSGFYRLRHGVSTNEYMSIVCDTINAQTIVAGLSNLTSDEGKTAAMNRVQTFLQADIKMVSDNIFTNPGTIIFLEKKSSGTSYNYDVISQGVGLKYISTCVYVGETSTAKASGLQGMWATINSVGNNLYTAPS